MAKTENVGGNRAVIDFPRDLLKTLVSPTHFPAKFEEERGADKEEIELSLGLSLNGRFGVDPKGLKLTRSSSIPDFSGGNGHEELVVQNGVFSSPSLARACSLPVETAEEWRKRKELQSLRRMEAKRKRSEKQRSLMGGKDRGRDNGGGEEEEEEKHEERIVRNLNGFSGVNGWIDKFPPRPLSSRASVGSQGSGSSAISEADTQLQVPPLQGKSTSDEVKSPLPEIDRKHQLKPEKSVETNGAGKETEIGKQKLTENGAKELIRDVLVDMPCVSTKGEGPNARRIEGFLYRYRKSEEVRIVCVCHGQFLTPAEFVKHAGGGEVAHPLKHIVVSPSFL